MTQKIMFVFGTSPEALASGTVHLVVLRDYEVSTSLDDTEIYSRMSQAVKPYGDGQVCRCIADILIGKDRYHV